MIDDAHELYQLLQKQDLLKEKPLMWWPSYGTFEVLVGAILTQNAQWKRVEVSLKNLADYMDIDSLSDMEIDKLESLIQPSGLFTSKAKYLKNMALAIKEEFGDFETFCAKVSREWLLDQKGVGPETADSILCYACKRANMVVDAYTVRLLEAFGYVFESYDDLQEWCVSGMGSYFNENELPRIYALFHGMIVEYVKANSKGKTIDIKRLKC